MRKILFVVNPIAGKGKASTLIPIINKKLKEIDKIEYKIIISVRKGMISELVRNNLKEKLFSDVIAVGGDGTLMEVVNGIDEFNVKIGLIPSGSGNDFAKTMNIPLNIYKNLDIIISNRYEDIYIGRINNYYFLNSIGVGLDARVLQEKEKSNIKNGKLKYFKSTVKGILNYKAMNISYKIDGIEKNGKTLMLTVNNGKYFGNGMKIAPNANIHSKSFNICSISDMNMYSLLIKFLVYIKESILK